MSEKTIPISVRFRTGKIVGSTFGSGPLDIRLRSRQLESLAQENDPFIFLIVQNFIELVTNNYILSPNDLTLELRLLGSKDISDVEKKKILLAFREVFVRVVDMSIFQADEFLRVIDSHPLLRAETIRRKFIHRCMSINEHIERS